MNAMIRKEDSGGRKKYAEISSVRSVIMSGYEMSIMSTTDLTFTCAQMFYRTMLGLINMARVTRYQKNVRLIHLTTLYMRDTASANVMEIVCCEYFQSLYLALRQSLVKNVRLLKVTRRNSK